MAVNVVIRVHEAQILAFTAPGGKVTSFLNGVLRTAEPIAKMRAPKRTGRLASSIEATRAGTNRPYRATGRLHARAPYARYVSRGTYGPIIPRRAPFLWVHPAWNGYPAHLAAAVSGQDANSYLQDAVYAAGTAHGLVFRPGTVTLE
jgi:hypothetical protein